MGLIQTMPLYDNVPEPKDKSWKLTTCPICKRACWDRITPDFLKPAITGKLCTDCVYEYTCDWTPAAGEGCCENWKNESGEKDG